MNTFLCGSLSALALLAFTSPLRAQAADPGVELAFMPRTMTVTLLNEGGKYVAVDLKHIPQGGTCRMDKDAHCPEALRLSRHVLSLPMGPFLSDADIDRICTSVLAAEYDAIGAME